VRIAAMVLAAIVLLVYVRSAELSLTENDAVLPSPVYLR
jgi:hypothetical protein